MQIYNFDDEKLFPLSNRDGIYGGNGGNKDGILIDGEFWFIKYPKTTRGMRNNARNISYTTAPLSEYLGSHVYEILGYDVHKTLLGIKKGKVVVACKDFCVIRGGLSEIRTIKNAYSEERTEELEGFAESKSGDRVNLPELLFHLEENRHLKNVEGLKEHFWDMVVVDILIDNNDRNNGNWGLVFNGEIYKIAPVYDNGNAFSNKTSDEQIVMHMQKDKLERDVLGASVTAYEVDGHILSGPKLIMMDCPGLRDAVKRNVPLIENHLQDIYKLIDDVPESYEGIPICSAVRKEYYKQGIRIRFEKILKSAYQGYSDGKC